MKVLVAVLSTRTPPYGEMIGTSKATWDSVEVPGVETIYYVGEPESPLEDRVIGFPVKESLQTMGHKNLAAWKWLLDHRDFDFMARVNASCYVHKRRLLARCAEHPATGLLSGGIVTDPPRASWLWGGYQFVMSRDVVQALADNPSAWNHDQMEDMALSGAAVASGFSFTRDRDACSIDRTGPDEWMAIATNGNTFGFSDWADVAKLDTQVFFRVKQDLRRHEDAMVMKNLHQYLLP